jgi:NitT/TauT family transport system permease protein
VQKKTVKKILFELSPLLGIGAAVLVWYLLSLHYNADIILPSPVRTLDVFFKLLGQKSYYAAVFSTLGRAAQGFAISFALAIIISAAAYKLPLVAKIFSPLLTTARVIPTISVILLAVMWFPSRQSPVFISALVAFPLFYASLFSSYPEINSNLIKMSRLFKVPLFIKVRDLYIPQIAPLVASSVKATLPLTIKVTIAAEVIAATRNSMGNNMQLARIYLDMPALLAWTLGAILIAGVFELLLSLVYKLTLKLKGA